MSDESMQSFSMEQVLSLMEICSVVNSNLTLDKILGHIINAATRVVKSEASSLLLLEQDKKQLYFFASSGEKSSLLKSCTLKMGEGIAGWVVQNGESVRINDAKKDERH